MLGRPLVYTASLLVGVRTTRREQIREQSLGHRRSRVKELKEQRGVSGEFQFENSSRARAPQTSESD